MKCPSDKIELESCRVGGVEVAVCRTCHGAWVALPLAGPQAKNWRALKISPNGMTPPCLACDGTMVERTLFGCCILVCDNCAKVWLSATALAMLQRKPTHYRINEELLPAVATLTDMASMLLSLTGR